MNRHDRTHARIAVTAAGAVGLLAAAQVFVGRSVQIIGAGVV